MNEEGWGRGKDERERKDWYGRGREGCGEKTNKRKLEGGRQDRTRGKQRRDASSEGRVFQRRETPSAPSASGSPSDPAERTLVRKCPQGRLAVSGSGADHPLHGPRSSRPAWPWPKRLVHLLFYCPERQDKPVADPPPRALL